MSKIKSDEPFYQISQVSKLIGITSDRLRTYEEEGLIKPYRATDSKSGKRLFTTQEIEWLEIIRELIKLGVTIPVIRMFLSGEFTLKNKNLKEKDKQIFSLLKKLSTHPVGKKL